MKLLFLLVIVIRLYAITAENVYNIARQYTNYPSTIVGMVFIESSCGRDILGDNGMSLGVMQLQVATVRYIAGKDNSLSWLLELSEKTIQKLLLRNDHLSIEIASKLINYYINRYGYFGAISRYNGGKSNHCYYNKVIAAKQRFLKDKK